MLWLKEIGIQVVIIQIMYYNRFFFDYKVLYKQNDNCSSTL